MTTKLPTTIQRTNYITGVHTIVPDDIAGSIRSRIFVHRTRVESSAEAVFDWHKRDGAFERLSPPWESVSLEDPGTGVTEGSRRVVVTRVGPLSSRWVMRHEEIRPGRQFVDVMERGPFSEWHHTHSFIDSGPGESILEDRIRFRLPLGSIGNAVAGAYVEKQLTRLFGYRHRIMVDDLNSHRKAKEVGTMRILMTGATGLIGSSLTPFLTTGGHSVAGLRRGNAGSGSNSWDPSTGAIDPAAIDGADAIIHLAGENIGAGLWTESRKRELRDSRVGPTRALCEALAKLDSPPRTLIVASAIGYYGNRGAEWLDETSEPGKSFLADLVRDWEQATEAAVQKGIRVVNLRFGIILTPRGGALQKLLLPFKLCVGGVVGSGQQYWSWVGIDDVIGVIHHALTDSSLQGAVNVVSPHPVTNREFTKTLARVLSRPAIFPLPAFAARLALGEMADELLLASARIRPTKLQASSYQFRNRDLEQTLRHLLGR